MQQQAPLGHPFRPAGHDGSDTFNQPSTHTFTRPDPSQSYAAPPINPPSSASNAHLTQPHLLPQSLDLGCIPAASGSQTSLLEAVVGPKTSTSTPYTQPSSAPPPSYTSRPGLAKVPSSHSRPASNTTSREHSLGSRSFSTSTEREWDVLSDASLKLNEGEGDPEAVEELQKQVNKRRSYIPHLESELAALEAQIKAAEEKIARAQSVGGARPSSGGLV